MSGEDKKNEVINVPISKNKKKKAKKGLKERLSQQKKVDPKKVMAKVEKATENREKLKKDQEKKVESHKDKIKSAVEKSKSDEAKKDAEKANEDLKTKDFNDRTCFPTDPSTKLRKEAAIEVDVQKNKKSRPAKGLVKRLSQEKTVDKKKIAAKGELADKNIQNIKDQQQKKIETAKQKAETAKKNRNTEESKENQVKSDKEAKEQQAKAKTFPTDPNAPLVAAKDKS